MSLTIPQVANLDSCHTVGSQPSSCGSGMWTAPQLVGCGLAIDSPKGTANSHRFVMDVSLVNSRIGRRMNCSWARSRQGHASVTTATIHRVFVQTTCSWARCGKTWRTRSGRVGLSDDQRNTPVNATVVTRMIPPTRGSIGASSTAELVIGCGAENNRSLVTANRQGRRASGIAYLMQRGG